MLRAGANSAEKKRAEQRHKGGAQTRQAIADTGERHAKRQHDRRAESLGHIALGFAEKPWRRQRAAEEPERRIGQAEFGLPQWQHDVDEVGKPSCSACATPATEAARRCSLDICGASPANFAKESLGMTIIRVLNVPPRSVNKHGA